MKPEAQRIAILEYLGWTDLSRQCRRGADGPIMALRGTDPSGCKNRVAPNPCHSLDVMHEVEKVLMDAGKWVLYVVNLGWVGVSPDRRILHASASQRCEAFLKTIGKWKEES